VNSAPPATPYRVCFVCTGNICRSPMAASVLVGRAASTSVAGRLEVSSAGTGPWHAGEPMDKRAADALHRRRYVDHGHVAQQFDAAGAERLDLIVALDRRHAETVRGLMAVRKSGRDDDIVLLRSFDPSAGGALDVPDPFYGDAADFDRCLAMVEAGCLGLLQHLLVSLAPPPR